MKQRDWVHIDEWLPRALKAGRDEAFVECKAAGVLEGTESQPKLAVMVEC
jgi:hypothetical protein